MSVFCKCPKDFGEYCRTLCSMTFRLLLSLDVMLREVLLKYRTLQNFLFHVINRSGYNFIGKIAHLGRGDSRMNANSF